MDFQKNNYKTQTSKGKEDTIIWIKTRIKKMVATQLKRIQNIAQNISLNKSVLLRMEVWMNPLFIIQIVNTNYPNQGRNLHMQGYPNQDIPNHRNHHMSVHPN